MQNKNIVVKQGVLISLLQGFRFANLCEIENFKHEIMDFYNLDYQTFSEMRRYIQELITPDMEIHDALVNQIQESSEHVMSYIHSPEDLQKEFVICL